MRIQAQEEYRMRRNLIVSLLAPVVLSAQQISAPAASSMPKFEVADVKPSNPSVIKMGKGRVSPGGRIDVPGYTLKDLIVFTFGVTDNMIFSGPKWLGTDRFDIVAKAQTDAPIQTLRLMMQSLLADRFRLTIHYEDKAMPAYVLKVVRSQPSLQKSSGGQSQCEWHELADGIRRRECHNLTLAEFARQLPGTGGIGIDLPVVDQTGLEGGYDFQFEVGTFQQKTGGGTAGGADTGPAPVAVDSGPTIFAALMKIGLKLDNHKMPMPVIVIDQVERPTGN
jgi:uncharacterized protein (TIGR03435 family)